MPRGKKELAEQTIPKLREVEEGRGKTVLEVVKKIGRPPQQQPSQPAGTPIFPAKQAIGRLSTVWVAGDIVG